MELPLCLILEVELKIRKDYVPRAFQHQLKCTVKLLKIVEKIMNISSVILVKRDEMVNIESFDV